MAKEIERKFLVRDDAWKGGVTSETQIRQAYICAESDRSVRIRTKNDATAQVTIKFGSNLRVRDEFEYPIPIDDAREMIGIADGHVIDKTRYTVDFAGFTWEVDVFAGNHRGLVIAEVEMQSETDDPKLPAWLGREVTGDKRYSNQSLATQRSRPGLVHAL
ncbi:MAG: CYTH domain-containing protein [Alphaproteobacteria bacterium]|jgi:adenylate cyclase|uniref:CYTH domain-containing protein n=1 Tax=Rhizobium/Agrobacterium group TaxID=227290 RepID=UPI0006B88B5A|nr:MULTISPECIES: CYTH domain-containing protein [Rhizobium/Agrobacterium group]MBU0738017.1 CYTH domain-containing protein [Alphaproteobacteria bacterium]MDM7981889.1 CYTH domain-containing protein [Rhizobium sp.]KPF60387.1 adenylate cyclase [Rhizobium sp. AAP116]MBU0834029.1 CYTH domain-containing protein [Alphaproteobacteria bacterium]MBU1763973.1 CYTH domain-containing protein [Alphaproteobacteria bacterium]